MSSLRHRLFHAGFAASSALRADRWLRPLAQGCGVILMFHHVRPWRARAFAPNRLLEIAPAFLDRTLRLAREMGFELVGLDEVPARLAGPVRAPFAALSFDDGYRDNLEHALPVLRRHQAPATIFVTTEFAEGRGRLWWLELEEALARLDRIAVSAGDERIEAVCRTPEEKAAAFGRILGAAGRARGASARHGRAARGRGRRRRGRADAEPMPDLGRAAAAVPRARRHDRRAYADPPDAGEAPRRGGAARDRREQGRDRAEARPAGAPLRLSGRRSGLGRDARVRPWPRGGFYHRGDDAAGPSLPRARRAPAGAAAGLRQRAASERGGAPRASFRRAVPGLEPRPPRQR